MHREARNAREAHEGQITFFAIIASFVFFAMIRHVTVLPAPTK